MRNVTPCPDWRERLSAYQDRALSPKDTKRVAAHLETCPDCRTALAQMERDRSRFVAAYSEPAEQVDLRQDILAELAMEKTMNQSDKPSASPLWKLRWALGGVSALALVCLVLLAAVLLSNTSQRTITSNTSSTGEPVHAGSDERLRSLGYLSSEADHRIVDTPSTATAPIPYDMKKPAFIARNIITAWAPVTNGRMDAGDKLTSANAESSIGYWPDGSLNYGVPGGLKYAFDVDYRLLVKNALERSRKAQTVINSLGGFTVNYEYVQNVHEPAYASFNGKVPAANAEKALQQLEKLGQVRGLTIAGEDLTEDFQRQLDEMQRQQEHIGKLGVIENRAHPRTAIRAEGQRDQAKGQLTAAKQALLGLTTKHELVTITATFYEATPREPVTLALATESTRNILHYMVLLFVSVAMLFLIIALLLAPFIGLRYLRRR